MSLDYNEAEITLTKGIVTIHAHLRGGSVIDPLTEATVPISGLILSGWSISPYLPPSSAEGSTAAQENQELTDAEHPPEYYEREVRDHVQQRLFSASQSNQESGALIQEPLATQLSDWLAGQPRYIGARRAPVTEQASKADAQRLQDHIKQTRGE